LLGGKWYAAACAVWRQTGLLLARVSTQWRPVAHEPDVPERICEPALPMGSPKRLVILNIVKITRCTLFQAACDHCVRVVTEHLDPCRCDPKLRGTFPTVVSRFPTKNGAPEISKPATEPRLHNAVAPSARLYHSTAVGVSATASITDMIGPCGCTITRSPFHHLRTIVGCNSVGRPLLAIPQIR